MTIWKCIRALALAFIVGLISVAPAAAEPPPLSVYGSLPAFEQGAISPSGNLIAVIGVIGDKRNLIVFNRENKPVLQKLVGNLKVSSLYWVGESAVLVRIHDTVSLGVDFTASKAELQTMLVVPMDNSEPWHVFKNKNEIIGGVSAFYGVSQINGEPFGYFSAMTLDRPAKGEAYLKTSNPMLYEVNLKTKATRRIAYRSEEYDVFRDWIVGPDGKVAATMDLDETTGKWTIKNSDKTTIAAGVNRLGGIDLRALSADAKSVLYWRRDETSGLSTLNEVALSGGGPKEIASKRISSDLDGDTGFTIVDDHTRTLVGFSLDGDAPAYSFRDPLRQKKIDAAIRAFPGSRVELIDWAESFDAFIVRVDGPGEPLSWWLIDIKTGDATILGNSYPMKSKYVAPMRTIKYRAADGLEIEGVLTLPPERDPKKLPVVVLPHGGPTARDYPGFDWWAQAFASRGYAVLQPNFRGSSGYGSVFEDRGDGEWGRKMQTDISDGLSYLAKEGIVDAKRACIAGGSYGGYAALAGVTLQKGIYRCAASFAGVADLQTFFNDKMRVSAGAGILYRSLQKEIGKGRALADVSPVRFAEHADAPILLIHGKDDTVVEYKQSTIMANALKRANKPVELVTLPNGDHWLSASETRLGMLEAMVAFIEKHNPADPPK